MPDSEPATSERGGAPADRVAVLGEVLFDCFPDGPRLGGAPFNVAWHLAALGLAPLFVSRVGADPLGERIRAAMGAHGMDPAGLQEDKSRPTGQVEITLDGRGGHAFRILPDQAYDHIEPGPVRALLGRDPPRLACFGTLCLRAPESRAAILEALADGPGTRLLDVNLRDGCWTEATVRQALEHATLAKLNDDELAVLGPLLLAPDPGDAEGRAAALRAGFGLEAVCVTRGAAGAVWHAPEGRHEARATPARVVDTVGAGDAFTAVLVTGRARGWPAAATLERAADFAAAVCGLRGACPDDPAFYAPFRAAWGLGGGSP